MAGRGVLLWLLPQSLSSQQVKQNKPTDCITNCSPLAPKRTGGKSDSKGMGGGLITPFKVSLFVFSMDKAVSRIAPLEWWVRTVDRINWHTFSHPFTCCNSPSVCSLYFYSLLPDDTSCPPRLSLFTPSLIAPLAAVDGPVGSLGCHCMPCTSFALNFDSSNSLSARRIQVASNWFSPATRPDNGKDTFNEGLTTLFSPSVTFCW